MRTSLLVVGVAMFALVAGCESGLDQGTAEIEAGDGCEVEGEQLDCGSADGVMSCYRTFDQEGSGSLVWSECTQGECAMGETNPCQATICVPGGPDGCTPQPSPGVQQCVLGDDGTTSWGGCQDTSSSTPLVLAFDQQPIGFTQATGAFALNTTMSVATDWVASSTPWLALDRNGNGAIDGGTELFGSATPLGGGFAEHGFAALAELDQNGDGQISGTELEQLLVWTDVDQNRLSAASEISSARSVGVVSIELRHHTAGICDTRGNCEMQTARFVFEGANGQRHEGRVVDVTLRHQ